MSDNSIRFIDSHYKDLFRIPDGGTVELQYPDGSYVQKCQYIDPYHLYLGSNPLHICELAEIIERNGGTVRPEPALNAERAAWEIGNRGFLTLQTTEDGWDYSFYDRSFHLVDGGQLDAPELSILEARESILQDMKLSRSPRTLTDYDTVTEKAERAASEKLSVLDSLKQNSKPSHESHKSKALKEKEGER